VRDVNGRPVAGAIVDVWHANPLGGYSFFDPSQPKYNLRRRIETDAEGRYRFRTVLPAGYASDTGCCTVRRGHRVPLDWAMTENNLGTALWKLGERESGTARLEEAVAAFRAALEERTREGDKSS
jgi:Dioxygenase